MLSANHAKRQDLIELLAKLYLQGELLKRLKMDKTHQFLIRDLDADMEHVKKQLLDLRELP